MFSDPISFIFCIIILAIFITVLLSFSSVENKISQLGSKLSLAAPTLLTSIGILGTFVGIIYALLNFNTDDLDNSIPQLLEGMKIAFLTSVVGMSTSILLKIIMVVLGKDDEKSENDILLDNIQRQRELLENKIPNILDQLVFWAEKQYKNTEDFKVEMLDKMDNFSEVLTEQTTQHIVEALEGIVVNFNDSLSNQFGENFALFEKSTCELLEWQKNYKSVLTKLVNKYDLNASTLNEVKQEILDIEQSLGRMPELVKDFEKVILFNQKQIGKIGDQMSIFADLKDKALETFPEIERYFNQMADNIQQSTYKFNQLLQQNTQSSMKQLSNLTNKMAENFEKEAGSIQKGNEEVISKLLSSNQKLALFVAELESILNKQLNQLHNQFSQTIQTTTEAQITEFKNVMEKLAKDNHQFIQNLEGQKRKSIVSKLLGGK